MARHRMAMEGASGDAAGRCTVYVAAALGTDITGEAGWQIAIEAEIRSVVSYIGVH